MLDAKMMPDAEIIAVGSELLTPQRLDTNSLYLTDQLNALGVEVVRKTVVGDERERLTDSILGAAARSKIVVLTGGLGPTEDDLTRDAVAGALGRTLVFQQDICDPIEARIRAFGRKMAEINRRQAYVIEGAEVLPNDRGTAPGQWISNDGVVFMLLPGPPVELKPMFEGQCLPRLEKLLPPQVIRTRWLRTVGMGESDLDQLISPVYKRYTNLATTILAVSGEIHIHLRARCATAQEAETLVAQASAEIEPLLGDRVYSCNGDSLEKVIGDLLRARHATLERGRKRHQRAAGRKNHGRPLGIGLFSRRIHHLFRSDEDPAAGRARGVDRRAQRGERTGGEGDGGRRAGGNRVGLRVVHHRLCGTGWRASWPGVYRLGVARWQ